MRIALIGYGKMGKRIEMLAIERGLEISHRIGSANAGQIEDLSGADVAIEFTSPDAAMDNFEKIAHQGIPIVTGTTGWYDDFSAVEALVRQQNIAFFYATNFSVGVQIALAASNYLASIMGKFPEYRSEIKEWHHTAKKDAPSGTAITFAEGVITHHTAYNKHELTDQGEPNTIAIQAYRENEIPGTHQVIYTSSQDQIHIEHKAFNRDGFSLGAIEAASFIKGKAPGMYTMQDLLKIES